MKNKKREISTKLIKGVIALVMLVLVVASILITMRKEQVIGNNSISDPEIARAMTYDRVQDGDAITNSDCVEFDAFFLRDLDGDGYAEGIRGTCREAGKTDTLYMELRVIKDGYLKNAKITVNNENFYLSTSIPKDDQIAKNAISDNTKEIVFNDISNGTQKLLTGTVKSNNSSYYKATAVGKDINKLSKSSSIVLSGIHVASDGTETEIEKVVNFNVDWYGEAKTRIPYSVYSGTPNLVQSKEIRECIDQENNTITLDFDVYTEETLYELNLKKSVIYGEIPQLGGQDPIDVQITGTNVTFSYDSSNRQYQAKIEATLDEDGKLLQNAYTDTYYQSRYSKYHIQVVYDLSAYYAMASRAFEYLLPVNAYYEAFNNPNDEFDNPYVTNVASNVAVITFEEQLPVGTEGELKVEVGDYLYSPTSRYVVSKKKPSYIYNGIDEDQGADTYRVIWNFYTGTDGTFDKLTLKEGEEDGEKVYDDIITTDGKYISAKDFSKYTKIEFKNADKFLGGDGWIKVYDDETDEVIATLDKSNWSSVYTYETPVRSVRVETSQTNGEVNFYVYHTKELDDNYIVENFTKEQFDEFKYIRVRAESYTNDTIFKSVTATAHYEAQLSVARVSVSPNTITSQETEKNEILTITTECNNASNEAYWKNGMFLIKLPSEIIQANINSVTTSADGVNIDNYEVYEENGNYFIKVITSNSVPTTFSIVINAKITPDPRITTVSRSVEMWSINAANENYYYAGDDIYDINGNKNTKEIVGKYTTSLVMVSPNALLTNQTAYNFNQDGTVVVAPQVAYVEKEQREATINIQIKNNYSKTISDINILGKIPYKGNTYTINKDDMGSNYSTIMEQSGIHVPDDIKGICEVYYSYEDEPTKELDNESNGWMKTPDDFSKVKSYLIVLKDYVMAKDETKNFYYAVNLPQGIDYNDISYSHYGVYFSLDTDNGKYRTQTEPNKLGLMIAKQYNLEIIKSQTDKEKKVEGASYSLQEEGSEDAVTKFTDENGKAVFEDILLERVYTVKEVISPKEYELNEGSFKFIAHEIDGTIEIEKLDGDVVSCDAVKNEGEDPKVVINVEDDVKANVKITKIELGSDNKLKSARYKLTGKNFENGSVVITDENGEATLTGLSLGEEYTLEEIKAPKGYYLNNDPIKFSVVNNNGKIELVKTEGTTKSEDVVIVDEIPTVNFTIEDEKIPTYDLAINKVSKGDNTPLPGVQFRLYYGKELLGTYESDDNGQILITGLYRYVEEKQVEQKYTLKEIYAPEGYAKIKDIEFYAEIVDGMLSFKTEATSVPEQLSENENSITITVEDAKSFKLTKIDGETAEVLPGTKFVIYNIDNGKSIPAVDSKGNTVGTLENINGKDYYVVETNEQGEISVNLPEGLYKAVEVQACDEKYDISRVKDITYYFGIGASRVGGATGDEGKVEYLKEELKETFDGDDDSNSVATYDGGIVYTIESQKIIVKLNESGYVEWQNNTVGEPYAIILNSLGHIVVGTSEGYMYEYADSGELIFENKIPYAIHSITEKNNNEYFIGTTNGLFYQADGTLNKVKTGVYRAVEYNNEYLYVCQGKSIIKYDLNFNEIFNRTFSFEISNMSIGNDGTIAVTTGAYHNSLTWTGLRICVIDADGNILNNFGTSNTNAIFYDIANTPDGGFVFAGFARGTSIFTSDIMLDGIEKSYQHGDQTDSVVVKTDSSGKIEWIRTISAVTGGLFTKSVVCDGSGNYVLCTKGYNVQKIIIEADDTTNNERIDLDIANKSASNVTIKILGSASVPEQSEILAENYRKEFNILTDVEEIDGVKGGTISGEDMKPYEKVKYGDSSTKEIKMVPNDEYEIISITLNGEEYPFTVADDGSFTMPQFDNVQENKRIVVKFAKSSNKITINKTDEITGERLPGVKFQIDQLEERVDPNVDLTGLTGNSSVYKYPDLDNEIDGKIGELTANGEEKVTAIDEVSDFNFGELTNNGTYYFIKNDDGTYTPTNSKTYQVANGGTAGKQSTTANSYIPIDLTGLAGKYAIKLSASCVSEGPDYGYATITESTTAPSYNSSDGRFVYISGTVNENEYISYSLDGGKVYYLHLGYRKDGSVDTGADQIVIKNIKLYSANATTYNFVENDGKYESNNQGIANSTAASYVPVDLTGLDGEYVIVVDASVSSEASYDYGYVNVREDTDRSTSNNIIQISGTKSQEGYKVVNGGKMYYVHLGYLKNASNDVNDDKFTINSIKLYGARSEEYNFIEEDGVYKSTNQGKSNTYARSYIPIDLTGYVGKYNLIVNAEISSESSNDYGYLIANTSTSQTTNGYFTRISGTVAAKDYKKELTGGKVYYLHMVYYKNASRDVNDDQFRINSIKLELSDSDLYHVTATTNSLGEATAQIPYGLYNITEIEPLDGYELTDPVEYRMESGKDNIVNITNKPLGKVVVHHYLLDSSGNETTTKLADDESYSGKGGETYTTVPRVDIDGYMLKRVDGEYVLPTNREGTYQDGQTIEVNYYYQVANYELTVHHYIEGTNTPVPLIDGSNAEDEKLEGKPGETYVTNKIADDMLSTEYELAEEPRNKTGIYEDEDIEVTYYYKIIKRNITLMKYDEDGVTPLSNAKFSILNQDESKRNKISVGKLQNNGTYGFVQSNGKYVSNNTNHDSTVANSYIKIDLTRETKDVEVTVNAQVSSEGNYDYGYATINESIQSPAYNDADGRFINISGSVSAKDYKTVITPGKVYYLHLGYRKDSSQSSGSDCFTVNSILINGKALNLYGESQYVFETNSNGMISTELEAGTYEISEVQAPEGYDLQDGIREINITRETPETIEIIDTKTRGNVIAHHYIEGTTDKVLLIDGSCVDDEEQIGVVGDMYATREKSNIVGYECVSSTDNTSGQYIDGTIEVIYYYRLLNYKYTVNYFEKGTNKQIYPSKMVNNIPYMTMINAVDEKIDIDGYNYDSVDVESMQITENENTNVINIYYTKRNDLNYKVNYLEKDINKVLSTQKVVENMTFDDEVVSANEVILIDGYIYDSVDKENLKITTGENVINIYYTKRNDLSYTVNYLEKGSEKILHEQKVVENMTFEDEVISENEVIAIDGYYYDSFDKANLKITTGENIINIYYIKRNDLSYTVNYLEKDSDKILHEPKVVENMTFEDEIISGNEVIVIDGYNYDSVDKEDLKITTGENVINIYYTKRNDLSYIVNYLEKDSNKILHEQKVVENMTFEDEVISENEVIAIDGYYYDSSDKAKMKITTGENIINIYYIKRNDLSYKVNYLEKNTNKILHEQKTVENVEYESIISSDSEIIEIDGYVYDSVEKKEIQIVTDEDTNIINIYYKKRKDLSYTVNYLEKNTDNIIKDSKYVDGVTFENVIKAEDEIVEIYGYNYDSVDKDTLIISTGLNEITIYYTKKDTRVLAHFYEENSTEKVSEDRIIEGKVFDEYSIDEPDDVPNKYELASRSDNYKGIMTEDEIEVIYYYRKKATKVVVRYYEEGTVNKLSQDVVIDGRVDDEYSTEAADDVPIKYELVAEPTNKEGIMTVDTIEVIYYYKVRDAVLNIRYLEKGTDIELAKSEQQHGKVEEDYITGPKTIDGYTLVEHTGNEKGKFEINPLTVTYYYLYKTQATVEYIDKNTGDFLKQYTKEGLEGDEFKTESINFPGYVLVEEPEKKTIIMAKKNETLKYYYVHVSGGVIEKHIDIVTDALLDNEVHEGNEGDPYEILPKDEDGYDLVEDKLPEKAKGTMTIDPIEVIYYYKYKTKVKAQYLDVITREPVADEVVIEGHETDEYETERKVIDGYKLIAVPENADGQMTKDEIVITYYYVHFSGGVIINHLDVKNNKQLCEESKLEGFEGDSYSTHEEKIDGYDLVKEKYPEKAEGNMTIESINVDYYYIKKTKVIVKYVDKETGLEIEPSDVIEGHEDDSFETTSKKIEGFELVEKPEIEKSVMKDAELEITYYYRRPAKVVVKYIDVDTKKELAMTEEIDGYQNDDYETEEKEIQFYNLTQSPKKAKGKMKVVVETDDNDEEIIKDTTEVIYYYKKKIFNLKIDKGISYILLNGGSVDSSEKMGKVEINRKTLSTTTIRVAYSINVQNTGELYGNGTIIEKIPAGFSMSSEVNPKWKIEGNIAKLDTEVLAPNEAEEYMVILDWKNDVENIGTKINIAQIESTENEAGFEEADISDNSSEADVVIAIGTGAESENDYRILDIAMLISLMIMAVRLVIIIKKD